MREIFSHCHVMQEHGRVEKVCSNYFYTSWKEIYYLLFALLQIFTGYLSLIYNGFRVKHYHFVLMCNCIIFIDPVVNHKDLRFLQFCVRAAVPRNV